MGGTSTDVCLCDKGVLPVTKDWHVEYGYPICFPSIEVLTIGAGGGSLAWIDKGGSLREWSAIGWLATWTGLLQSRWHRADEFGCQRHARSPRYLTSRWSDQATP